MCKSRLWAVSEHLQATPIPPPFPEGPAGPCLAPQALPQTSLPCAGIWVGPGKPLKTGTSCRCQVNAARCAAWKTGAETRAPEPSCLRVMWVREPWGQRQMEQHCLLITPFLPLPTLSQEVHQGSVTPGQMDFRLRVRPGNWGASPRNPASDDYVPSDSGRS